MNPYLINTFLIKRKCLIKKKKKPIKIKCDLNKFFKIIIKVKYIYIYLFQIQ